MNKEEEVIQQELDPAAKEAFNQVTTRIRYTVKKRGEELRKELIGDIKLFLDEYIKDHSTESISYVQVFDRPADWEVIIDRLINDLANQCADLAVKHTIRQISERVLEMDPEKKK